MTKCDYLKGVTAGMKLRAKLGVPHGKHQSIPRNDPYTVRAEVQKAEDKYRDSLGENDSLARAFRYSEGVRHAIEYNRAGVFVVVRFDGSGHYNAGKLADRTVYTDPAVASARAWELDPNGHDYTSLEISWVNGAAKELDVDL